MIIITMFVLLFLLIATGIPLAMAIALACIISLWIGGGSILQVFQTMWTTADSWVLLAIPLFMLTGELMDRAGVLKRLIRLCNAVLGPLPGSLAIVNVVVSMIFGGASGSAIADTSAVGSTLIPVMEDEGYDLDFSAAITAASSPIGIIIPPSIPMVFFGWIAGVSVGDLFLGGMIPGILVGVSQIVYCYFISIKRGYRAHSNFSIKEVYSASKEGLPALFAPVLLIGGILFGIFTPTEAAAVAVMYTLLLGIFYRELSIKDFFLSIYESAKTTGMVMFVAVAASAFAYIINMEGGIELISGFISQFNLTPTIFLFILFVLSLLLGMFIGVNESILIAVPVLLPVMTELGVDLIHAGVIMVAALGIGLLTPPVALCTFIASSVSGCSVEKITRASIPFIIIFIIIVTIMILYPPIVTYVPGLSM